MKQIMNLLFESDKSPVYNIDEINSSFARGSLKVLYLGNNRNGSYFSKKAVEKALPSLKNVPIVCHWDSESKEIGGHDMEVVREDDGSLRLRNLTEPCGVVPDHAQFSFEKETDDAGIEHEYLVIDGVLLWKRQDVYNHIVNELDGKVKHSMEITVNDGSVDTETGFYHINDFEFTALCLLENCQPCFQGSELELFSTNDFKQKMEQMMKEFKESINLVTTSLEDDKIHPQNYSTEGGKRILEEKEKLELLAKYGIDAETVEFSIEETSIEKLEEFAKNMTDEAPNLEQDNFALTEEVVNELIRVLRSVEVEREWGSCPRYIYVDCDLEAHEVYCWDIDDWLLYGFTYEPDNDSFVINFESKKRKKYAIIDFDEGEQESPFAQIFSDIEQKIHENLEWQSKYQETSNKIETMNAELEDLRKFKADTEEAINQAKIDEVLAKFEELAGIEEFDTLCAHCAEYSVEALEEKCYAIRGKHGTTAKFAVKQKNPVLHIEKTDYSNEPYGGVFVKYNVGNE